MRKVPNPKKAAIIQEKWSDPDLELTEDEFSTLCSYYAFMTDHVKEMIGGGAPNQRQNYWEYLTEQLLQDYKEQHG
jgi:hypothetical protein